MKDNQIILQGGGDHARVVLDSLLKQGKTVAAIFDPKLSGELFGVPQMGIYQPDKFPTASMIVAIGDNRMRQKVAINAKHHFATLIDPTSTISPRAVIGEGSMVLHRTVVQANTMIGKHVIINTGAQVDHDCAIGDFVHIGPGSVLCGTINIGEGTFIGAGTVIIPGVKIGKWSIVGAGSVVIKDIPDYTMVVGNPARVVKNIPA
jgi:sugar O-acyltransferase (sialic acid O-acetyltransferase NeuD family)